MLVIIKNCVVKKMGISDLLFYGGLLVAGCSIFCGIIATIILRKRKEQLQLQLEREYGKR